MRINSLKTAVAATVAAAIVSLCGYSAIAGGGARSLADSPAQVTSVSAATVSTGAVVPQATQESNDPWD